MICVKCGLAPRAKGKSVCAPCNNARAKRWRDEHRDEVNRRRREKRRANPEALYDEQLRQRYGIGKAEVDRMLAEQQGCAICHRWVRVWHVDHDHACCPDSGKSCGGCIRGILCADCNRGLGQFADDPGRLLAAVSYLGSN